MDDNKASKICVCCGRSATTFSFTKKTDKGEFRIIKCPACRSSFVWPRPNKEETASIYETDTYSNLTHEEVIEQDRRYYPNASTDTRRIITWCKRLSNGRRFLDVGAGFGHYSRRAGRCGFEVVACEPNANARSIFFRMNGFSPDPSCFDEEYAKRHKKKFDVVLLSQVLEHVTDLQETLCGISTVLQDGGIAAIAVPHFGSGLSRIQGQNDMYISPPEHLNFFSRRGLSQLFERNSFELEVLETVSKVNRGRVEDVIGVSVFSHLVWGGLYGILKIFELFGLGMVINAYFRKT